MTQTRRYLWHNWCTVSQENQFGAVRAKLILLGHCTPVHRENCDSARRLCDTTKKVWNHEKLIKQKSIKFLEKFIPKIFLVPWDFFRVPGSHFRHHRVLRYPDNIFSSIIYCPVLINWRFCCIKSKDSNFICLGSQFLLVNKLNRGRLGQKFFAFSITLMFRPKNEMLKTPRNTKTGSGHNQK